MGRIELIPELEDIAAGCHLCHLYATEDERRDVLLSFLSAGLRRGEKVVCVGEEASRHEISTALEGVGLNPAEHLRSGQLAFVATQEVFTRDGSFDPEAALEFWNKAAGSALRDGWPSLRATCEMSWLLARPPG